MIARGCIQLYALVGIQHDNVMRQSAAGSVAAQVPAMHQGMSMMHETAAVAAPYDDYPMYGNMGDFDQHSYYYDGLSGASAAADWQSGSHMDGVVDDDGSGCGGYGAGDLTLWSY